MKWRGVGEDQGQFLPVKRTQSSTSGCGWWRDACPQSESVTYYCPLPPSRSLPTFVISNGKAVLCPAHAFLSFHQKHNEVETCPPWSSWRPPPMQLCAALHLEPACSFWTLTLLHLRPLGTGKDCPVFLSRLQYSGPQASFWIHLNIFF